MRAFAVVLAAVASFAACGNSKPLTGSAGVAGSSAGAGSTGAAGAGAGTGGAAGSDAQPRCDRTNDAAKITVQSAEGQTFSCDTASRDAGAQPTAFVDEIAEIMGNTIVFSSGARVAIDAPGLDLSAVPRHLWVQVKYQFTSFFGCTQLLELTVAIPPDGASQGTVGLLILAASDGAGPFPESSYTVDRVPLGCTSAKGCGSPAPDEYAFDFKTKSGTTPAARAYMGEVVLWFGGAQAYMARNLRSYQTTLCDDYWNFAYTIVPALAETIP